MPAYRVNFHRRGLRMSSSSTPVLSGPLEITSPVGMRWSVAVLNLASRHHPLPELTRIYGTAYLHMYHITIDLCLCWDSCLPPLDHRTSAHAPHLRRLICSTRKPSLHCASYSSLDLQAVRFVGCTPHAVLIVEDLVVAHSGGSASPASNSALRSPKGRSKSSSSILFPGVKITHPIALASPSKCRTLC
ncbi:hypothetical protein KC324_g86 [Hortaea werneckii]|nr:hypothetical protein KC324_g86 [Hortaea werneckii]